MKALIENRNDLVEEQRSILNKAKMQTRAINEDEVNRFEEIEKEIKAIDKTIELNKRMMQDNPPKIEDGKADEADVKAFAGYIRSMASGIQVRSETNLTKGDNGAVIPTTIAQKIIEKVAEISPLYKKASGYKVKGTLVIPVVDNSADDIEVAYASEFADLVSHSAKFTAIELKGYLIGALTKISKSLLNGSDIDLVKVIINDMASKIAAFLDKEMINGTDGKIEGIAKSYDKVNMTITTASKDAVTLDELMDLQDLVPDVYQEGSIWIMSRTTRKAIRKLKDKDGNFYLNKDATAKWGYSLFGRDVYTSGGAEKIGAATKPIIIYGDPSGLAVKTPTDLELQILLEKFATQHSIGIVAWHEVDAKVENKEKLAVMMTPGA